METSFKGMSIFPKREPVAGTCVDCGRDVTADCAARVLRRPSADRTARVVCNDCFAKIHAVTKPAPIMVQRAMPKRQSQRVEG